MSLIEAYPLAWPEGWRRLGEFQYRDPSRFKVTSFTKVRDGLLHEVELLGGLNTVLSSNLPTRRDGLPYAKFSQPKDPGVAIYFTLKKKPMVFACDQFPKVECNMHSIQLSIGAIRGLQRWGASDMLERAFKGFQQLPAPAPESSVCPWSFLVVQKGDFKGAEVNYKKLAKSYHPDIGQQPNSDMMIKTNNAIEQIRKMRSEQ